MMTFKVMSYCGDSFTYVDLEDIDLNPAVVCCDNCRSIRDTRRSWAEEYGYLDNPAFSW